MTGLLPLVAFLAVIMGIHAAWNSVEHRRLGVAHIPMPQFLLLNRPQRIPAIHAAILLVIALASVALSLTKPPGLEDVGELLPLMAAGLVFNLVLDVVAFLVLRVWDRNKRASSKSV